MLKKQELQKITGGGWQLSVAIGTAITFLLGLIDGILKPVECKSAK